MSESEDPWRNLTLTLGGDKDAQRLVLLARGPKGSHCAEMPWLGVGQDLAETPFEPLHDMGVEREVVVRKCSVVIKNISSGILEFECRYLGRN